MLRDIWLREELCQFLGTLAPCTYVGRYIAECKLSAVFPWFELPWLVAELTDYGCGEILPFLVVLCHFCSICLEEIDSWCVDESLERCC